jgi:hypothetical protein
MASRTASTRYERFVNDMGKHPDFSAAVKVGQPTLVDPKQTDAPNLVREINAAFKAAAEAGSGTGKIEVETVSGGGVPANQPVPRSAEPAVKPSDIPAQAPPQLNESASSSTAEKPADKAADSSSTATTKDAAQDASSSRKTKKKRHFKLPIPL